MSNQAGQREQVFVSPDKGIREFGVPGDPAGFIGAGGIQNSITFTDQLVILGIPQAVAAAGGGALYYSFIHGATGSDVRNAAANIAGAGARPAFPNPEVTGYPTAGNTVGTLSDGHVNAEKRLRSATDAAAGANDATVWVPTQGKSQLAFDLWVSSAQGATFLKDWYSLEVYRDINNQDKGGGIFGGLATDLQNAQCCYQYGPFEAVPESQPQANAQAAGIPISAGCNLYIVLRNISNAGRTNHLNGSIRFQ